MNAGLRHDWRQCAEKLTGTLEGAKEELSAGRGNDAHRILASAAGAAVAFGTGEVNREFRGKAKGLQTAIDAAAEHAGLGNHAAAITFAEAALDRFGVYPVA